MGVTGIFVGKTGVELLALIAIAEDRIAHGDRTSLSGAGKSSGRTFSMSAADMLREARYAYDKLMGINRTPSRTYFDARMRP